jgi:hypothetical protein
MELSPLAPATVSGSSASAIAMPTTAAPAVPALSASSASPLLDFPGVTIGDRYVVGNGTKVGKFGSVKGAGEVLKWNDDAASFHIKAGKFGINVDLNVDITRLDGDRVLLHTGSNGMVDPTTGTVQPETDIVARTVVSRTNYAEFVGVDDPSMRTTIQRDSANNIIIDASVPQAGGPVHIVLNPR